MANDADHVSAFAGKETFLLEDDLLLRKRLTAAMENMGAEVTTAGSLEEARNALAELRFDYLLLDLNLPDGLSLDLLRDGVAPNDAITVLMTAEGGVRSAVEAIRLGAADYLTKPFDPAELSIVFHNADAARRRMRRREHDKETSRRAGTTLYFEDAFAPDLAELNRITDADARLGSHLPPVLIDGPTGSGKSTYARWIHENGPRADAPLVEVNCSAIPENLVESELFGHEKGAFTDAKGARIGLFEAAHGGTLFLDEVASLAPAAQAKLLTAIEDGRIRPVGGSREREIDARVITAANQDLRELVAEGAFREDLLHRLDLLRLSIAPLATRGEGILSLARHLLAALARKYKLSAPEISESGQARLLAHLWPGNARELAHELERSLVLNEPGQALDFPNLPIESTASFAATASHGPTDDWLAPGWIFPEEGFKLEEAALRLIRKAIEQAGGNVSGAARLLGVPRDYVRYRLKKAEEES